jgi:hypothetical protein
VIPDKLAFLAGEDPQISFRNQGKKWVRGWQ